MSHFPARTCAMNVAKWRTMFCSARRLCANTRCCAPLLPVHTILLTGWALHPGAFNIYKDVGRVLPLSDHAGFDDLIRYVEESGARRVYTVHGGTKFATILRERGIDAHFLAGMGAKTMNRGDARDVGRRRGEKWREMRGWIHAVMCVPSFLPRIFLRVLAPCGSMVSRVAVTFAQGCRRCSFETLAA